MLVRRALAPTLAVVALALAGCGDDAAPGGSSLVRAEPGGAGHVHGLAVLGDQLLIATHAGLWRAPAGGKPARVGASRRDIMGFTVLGSRLVGSGHPDPMEDTGEPANVGFIESADGGRSWRPVSLAGEVDFHAMAAGAATVYGYDGGSGRLMASSDGGRTWGTLSPPAPVISIAVDPRRDERVLVSTPEGVYRSEDGGAGWRPVEREVVLLTWGRRGAWSVTDAGAVRRSTDGGRTWSETGRVDGTPVAITSASGGVVIATESGAVLESADGRSFTQRADLH